MGMLNTDLLFIKELYPQFSSQIDELYKKDPEFQVLCADFFLAKKNLKEFQRQLKEGHSSIKDYEDVSIELEKASCDFIRSNE
jgi:hypothetical protein